ncbi:MAG TPA: phosphoglucomutase/phosphomannomutase family protein [Dehalococcoidia bacterium]|nr:phosphoglucomutase/phosphomannomutase family protein [Dehalococcoidia bacterium]
MSSPIKFGTDGWRGLIADDFTFANVRICAQAIALYLKDAGLAERGLVIGFDTRFGSEEFAEAVAEIAAGNGIHVYLCDHPAPTPVIGYSILDLKAGGSAVITASHNPRQWNGFKFRPEYAGSAPPEVLAQIEGYIPGIAEGAAVPRLPFAEAQASGLVQLFDPAAAYRSQIARLIDLDRLRAAGLRVVVDSMHGAASGYIAGLLSGGKTRVLELRSERNPYFPGMHNPEPIARNLQPLAEAIRLETADVGLATDGDGDRLGLMDENGNFINQLEAFALLTYYMLEVRGLRGPIVKSVTTTQMVKRLGELYGVPVYETGVGFKYLGPKMTETDALIAGEESGGYAFRGHLPERDGVLSALYFLDLMASRGKKPSALLAELFAKVGPHYYDRIDIELAPEQALAVRERVAALQPSEIAGRKVLATDTTDGFRYLLDEGWVLIRFSGTEPLVRIYTELSDRELVPQVLQDCRRLAGI